MPENRRVLKINSHMIVIFFAVDKTSTYWADVCLHVYIQWLCRSLWFQKYVPAVTVFSVWECFISKWNKLDLTALAKHNYEWEEGKRNDSPRSLFLDESQTICLIQDHISQQLPFYPVVASNVP